MKKNNNLKYKNKERNYQQLKKKTNHNKENCVQMNINNFINF